MQTLFEYVCISLQCFDLWRTSWITSLTFPLLPAPSIYLNHFANWLTTTFKENSEADLLIAGVDNDSPSLYFMVDVSDSLCLHRNVVWCVPVYQSFWRTIWPVARRWTRCTASVWRDPLRGWCLGLGKLANFWNPSEYLFSQMLERMLTCCERGMDNDMSLLKQMFWCQQEWKMPTMHISCVCLCATCAKRGRPWLRRHVHPGFDGLDLRCGWKMLYDVM